MRKATSQVQMLRQKAAFSEFLHVVGGALPDAFGGVAQHCNPGKPEGCAENCNLVFFLIIELAVELADHFFNAVGDDLFTKIQKTEGIT